MVYSSSYTQTLSDDEVSPEDLDKLRAIASVITPVIKSQFGNKPIKVLACAIDERDRLQGFFQSLNDKTYWSFQIDADDELTYSEVGTKRFDAWHFDGLLLKKRCKIGVPCGSGCIPKGTVCHIGLPTAGQAKTALIRKIYKSSARVARAAGKVALAAGVGMLAAYAIKHANSPEGQKRIGQAASAVGLNDEAKTKLRNFASEVAKHSKAPDSVVEALKAPAPKPTFNDKVKAATKAYAQSWKNAPVKTSMAHLGAGLAVVGSAEMLGYLPQGSVMTGVKNAVGKEAMQRRYKNFQKRREGFKVKTRNPGHGG